jgi:hypothetical protein
MKGFRDSVDSKPHDANTPKHRIRGRFDPIKIRFPGLAGLIPQYHPITDLVKVPFSSESIDYFSNNKKDFWAYNFHQNDFG